MMLKNKTKQNNKILIQHCFHVVQAVPINQTQNAAPGGDCFFKYIDSNTFLSH